MEMGCTVRGNADYTIVVSSILHLSVRFFSPLIYLDTFRLGLNFDEVEIFPETLFPRSLSLNAMISKGK